MRRRGKLCNEELYTFHPSKKVTGATKLRKLRGVDTCRARERSTAYRIGSENLNGRDHFWSPRRVRDDIKTDFKERR
jgi:hypothetical protein